MNEKISKSMLWFSVAFIASSVASMFALASLFNLKLTAAATFVQGLYTISALMNHLKTAMKVTVCGKRRLYMT